MTGRSMRPPVKQKGFGQTTFFVGDADQALDLLRIDLSDDEPAFAPEKVEDGIDTLAGSSGQTERDIRAAEDRFDVQDLLLDEAD